MKHDGGLKLTNQFAPEAEENLDSLAQSIKSFSRYMTICGQNNLTIPNETHLKYLKLIDLAIKKEEMNQKPICIDKRILLLNLMADEMAMVKL